MNDILIIATRHDEPWRCKTWCRVVSYRGMSYFWTNVADMSHHNIGSRLLQQLIFRFSMAEQQVMSCHRIRSSNHQVTRPGGVTFIERHVILFCHISYLVSCIGILESPIMCWRRCISTCSATSLFVGSCSITTRHDTAPYDATTTRRRGNTTRHGMHDTVTPDAAKTLRLPPTAHGTQPTRRTNLHVTAIFWVSVTDNEAHARA